MPNARHRSRAELPPTPVELAYPLAVPDAAVLGAVILHETPDSFALHVFRALRLTFAWAAGPEVSGAVFDAEDLDGWEADVLGTAGVDEALWAPISVIAGELARPAEVDPERLVHACLAVTDWALGCDAGGTAILFAEAAAAVWPTNARLAWIVGKLNRERLQLGRAETWLRRASRIAVWTGDWELQAQAINSLGNLKVHLGDFAGGRELLLQASRLAKRKRLRERQAKVLHDLLAVSIYAGRFDEAEGYAKQSFSAYGPDHPDLINLAFDVSNLWLQQGQFSRAFTVLKALHSRFADDDRQLRVLASTARAAGVVGDVETFHRAWINAWALIDVGAVEHLRAAAPLELGLGALSLGLWDYAELALITSRDAAQELREGDTLVRAESSLDHLRRRQSADRASRPSGPHHLRSEDLAVQLVRSLSAQTISTGGEDWTARSSA
jgi:tetratricopeptide (TPR) repeat protein